VVNALSEWLELTVWRNDTEYRARFEDGDCTVHVHEVGPAPGRRGTEVRFLASAKINRPDGTFSNLDYSFKTLETPAARTGLPEFGRPHHPRG
jgi:DNA gyrase subunit B